MAKASPFDKVLKKFAEGNGGVGELVVERLREIWGAGAKVLATVLEEEVVPYLSELVGVGIGDISPELAASFGDLISEAKAAATLQRRLESGVDSRIADALWSAQEAKRKKLE